MHTHITEYNLETLNEDILNDKLFGFIQVDIKTPENLKAHFSEMTPIFNPSTAGFRCGGKKSVFIATAET